MSERTHSGGPNGVAFRLHDDSTKGAVDNAVFHDQAGRVNIDESIAAHIQHDGELECCVTVREMESPPESAVAHLSPATGLRSCLDEVSDLNDNFTLGELTAHYVSLLQRGYRATRWHHPQLGGAELLPSGVWKFSAYHPASPRKGNGT